MFARSSAAQQYATVGLESKVLAAHPHRLVVLLFDGAIEAVNQAADHMRAGRTDAKQRMVGKAVAIIVEGLRASLDHERGGPIAGQLDALYEYLTRRLFDASHRNDEAGFAEVTRLLAELRGAWAEIDPQARPAAGAAQMANPLPTSGAAPTRAYLLV